MAKTWTEKVTVKVPEPNAVMEQAIPHFGSELMTPGKSCDEPTMHMETTVMSAMMKTALKGRAQVQTSRTAVDDLQG